MLYDQLKFKNIKLLILLLILIPISANAQNRLHMVEYPGANTYSAMIDGTNFQTITSTTNGNLEIEIDPADGRRYWSAYLDNKIVRSELNGTSTTILYDAGDGVDEPFGIAIDPANNRMYWSQFNPGNIMCGNMDGSGTPTVVLAGLTLTGGIEIDTTNNFIYFAGSGEIQRVPLIGTTCLPLVGNTTLVSGISRPYAIALDIPNNKMYWADSSGNRLGTANLNGSSANLNLWTGLSFPTGLDLEGTELFWNDYNTARTRKANADGTGGITDLVVGGTNRSWGIAIYQLGANEVAIEKSQSTDTYDIGDSITYTIVASNFGSTNLTGITVTDTMPTALPTASWTCSITTGIGSCTSSGTGDINESIDLNSGAEATFTVSGTIAAAGTTITNTADISHPSDFFAGNNTSTVVAYKDNHECMYLSEYTGNRTFSAEKGGANLTTLTTTPTGGTFGIAVDYPGGKYYWTSFTGNRINSANLNGSSATILFDSGDGISRPWGLAIDPDNNKLYWAEDTNGRIRCANLDGTGSASNVVTGLNSPTGVAIDTVNNRLYWTEIGGTDRIARGNIAANCGTLTAVTTILSGPGTPLNNPYMITVDETNAKIYWSEFANGSIGVANLNGSSPDQNLLSGLTNPGDLDVDPIEGFIYWNEYGSTATKKAPVDGSSPPLTLTGIGALSNNWGLALCTYDETDISVTKTALGSPFVRGLNGGYTVVVTNNGPSNATGLNVVDIFPTGYSSANWTCAITGTGSCTASGSGNINDTINLNNGSTATYTITGYVEPTAPDTLINTAGVVIPVGLTDTDPSNDLDSESVSVISSQRRIFIID